MRDSLASSESSMPHNEPPLSPSEYLYDIFVRIEMREGHVNYHREYVKQEAREHVPRLTSRYISRSSLYRSMALKLDDSLPLYTVM